MKAVLLVVVMVLMASSVSAHGWAHHEFLEDGMYDDLVEYRESTGHQVMTWILSEEDFRLAQERYALRESSGWRGHCGRW